MTVFDYYIETFKKYGDFEGRARRMEYWSFQLINRLVYLALVLITVAFIGITGSEESLMEKGLPISVITGIGAITIYWLISLVPNLAVAVRRLHDSGKSGWFLLLFIIPMGVIVLLVFLFLDSEKGLNQWGPNPKGEMPLSAGPDDRWLHTSEKDLV